MKKKPFELWIRKRIPWGIMLFHLSRCCGTTQIEKWQHVSARMRSNRGILSYAIQVCQFWGWKFCFRGVKRNTSCSCRGILGISLEVKSLKGRKKGILPSFVQLRVEEWESKTFTEKNRRKRKKWKNQWKIDKKSAKFISSLSFFNL